MGNNIHKTENMHIFVYFNKDIREVVYPKKQEQITFPKGPHLISIMFIGEK